MLAPPTPLQLQTMRNGIRILYEKHINVLTSEKSLHCYYGITQGRLPILNAK